ncbi:hypothetical protein C7S18_16735 [Ahniella affigens]|uniref:Tetratricopeptide repeat protein n=1 Tax=Ahniella affigens TaxID=2021234 RepID=A0A2P1PV59_9GAMM|nr:hypothetical protein [Ahniella affigens]AVP98733.1 hypothetical protein C7S18_16735 [Ahniella affigens]
MNRIVVMVGGVLVALMLGMASPVASAHRHGIGMGVHLQVSPRHCWRIRACHGWRVRAAWRHLARIERRADRRAIAQASRTTAELDALALERLYRRQGKPESAVQMYEDIVRQGQHPELMRLAHRRLALWAIKHDQPEQAEAHLRANLDASLER